MNQNNVEILTSNGVDVEKSLELFGDINTYNDTIGELLNAIDKKIPQLEEYIRLADMANYAILVHSLKSDARYFGFTELGEIAYQHELNSKENNLSYVNMHFNELKESASRAYSLIKQYLKGEPIIQVQEQIVQQPRENNPQKPVENVETLVEKTFLIADDSNIVRSFVEKALQGKEVKIVEDGKDVINIIKANENMINGMLLDLNMPNVDGFKVLEFLKEQNLFNKIPVSIITGESAKEIINKAYEYKIVDILTKPFSETELKRVVEKTIDIINWN